MGMGVTGGSHNGYAVLGQSENGIGVKGWGFATTGSAIGVQGISKSPSGVGVSAENPGGGQALRVQGQASFSTAGLATIAKGQKSITVAPGFDIAPTSKVFVSLQSWGGTLKTVDQERDREHVHHLARRELHSIRLGGLVRDQLEKAMGGGR